VARPGARSSRLHIDSQTAFPRRDREPVDHDTFVYALVNRIPQTAGLA
jgi:hypothetical protein